MTHSSHSKSSRYRVVRSTDGCDETFQVRRHDSRIAIAVVPVFDDVNQARRSARKIASALDILTDVGVYFDLHALLAEKHQMAIVWTLEDVHEQRRELTDEQAWDVLQFAERTHDANFGITWEHMSMAADHLFPLPSTN